MWSLKVVVRIAVYECIRTHLGHRWGKGVCARSHCFYLLKIILKYYLLLYKNKVNLETCLKIYPRSMCVPVLVVWLPYFVVIGRGIVKLLKLFMPYVYVCTFVCAAERTSSLFFHFFRLLIPFAAEACTSPQAELAVSMDYRIVSNHHGELTAWRHSTRSPCQPTLFAKAEL